MSAEMVNPVTGECLLTDKEGREYHLLFDLTAVAALETMSNGETVFDIIERRPGVLMLARMLVAGSQGYARRNPTTTQRINPGLAMKVIVSCGGIQKIVAPVTESLCRSEGMGMFDDEGLDPGAGDGDGDGDGDGEPPLSGPGRGL